MSGLFNGNKYPNRGDLMVDVTKVLIDEIEDLRRFQRFVLQDSKLAEQYEKFKTFDILKDTS